MILPIVGYGASVLKQQAVEITKDYPELPELIENMFTTMYAANGVGLAAVQVGILRRVVVMDCGDGYIELINPEIVKTEVEQFEDEGCLSLPGEIGTTCRPATVRVQAQDRNGKWCIYKGEELKARCFCHELDHLDGVVFTQRVIKEIKE